MGERTLVPPGTPGAVPVLVNARRLPAGEIERLGLTPTIPSSIRNPSPTVTLRQSQLEEMLAESYRNGYREALETIVHEAQEKLK